jgi:hypothetical protein
MLFDIRSRGRRRTVQGVYLGLALLLGGGLILFGVGTGNGVGGLLNGIGGNGSSNSKPVIGQAEKSALRETQTDPSSPAAWSALVEARYEAAGQDSNPTTGAYTSAGMQELRGAAQAWQRYLALTKKPNWTLAELIAQAYDKLGEYSQETSAWQIVTAANPTAASYFEDLADAAWKAKETDLGDLASAKAIALTPKAQQLQVKTALQQLKTQAASGTSSSAASTSSTASSSG